jgi:pimeloyl-ACP methyl ester carboxylesterase
MDLRGYAGSDKTPVGYDPVTLAQDVAGVVKSLGARRSTVVGHGWGGYVGWAAATLHPREVAALCAVSAPHPLALMGSLRPGATAWRHLLAAQVPWLPERRLADPGSGYLRDHLRAWSAPGSAFPDDEALTTYQQAMSQWPAPHCAWEYHRWLFRSRVRADGRRFDRAMRPMVAQPVCSVSGTEDPALPAAGVERSRARVAGAFTARRMSGVGHFPHEEDPAAFTALLLAWLAETVLVEAG